MFRTRAFFRATSIVALLFVTGCGSALTELDLPASVESGETFNYGVTHVYSDESGPVGVPPIFSAIIPEDWTPSATGTYSGNWGGVAFSAPALLSQTPPDSDALQLLAVQEDCANNPDTINCQIIEVILSRLDCVAAPPEVPEGSVLVWYLVDMDQAAPAPGSAGAGDGGTLLAQLTAGQVGGSQTLVFQHGIYDQVDDDPVTQVCVFYSNIEVANGPDDIAPDSISGVIEQFSLDTAPVPALGAGMLVLLAGLMGIAGVRIGRKRSQK